MATPVFKGMTRPVSFGGLPMTYIVMLIMVVAGGFAVTLSFIYLIVSAAIGYGALRVLASYDARFFDVLFTVLAKTPFTASFLKGKGVIYHA